MLFLYLLVVQFFFFLLFLIFLNSHAKWWFWHNLYNFFLQFKRKIYRIILKNIVNELNPMNLLIETQFCSVNINIIFSYTLIRFKGDQTRNLLFLPTNLNGWLLEKLFYKYFARMRGCICWLSAIFTYFMECDTIVTTAFSGFSHLIIRYSLEFDSLIKLQFQKCSHWKWYFSIAIIKYDVYENYFSPIIENLKWKKKNIKKSVRILMETCAKLTVFKIHILFYGWKFIRLNQIVCFWFIREKELIKFFKLRYCNW